MSDVEEFVDTGAGLEEEIKVPKDRVGVVIGRKGKTRKRLESVGNVRINVDSKTGEVRIRGGEDTDPLTFMRMGKVIRAIGRGFDPDTALKLLADDYDLEVINLREHMKKSDIPRQRARLIGTGGSARKKIETLTDTDIRVYGDTVSIIGDYEGIEMAKKAIKRLAIDGSPHSVVFRDLELQRKRRKMEKLFRDLGIVKEED